MLSALSPYRMLSCAVPSWAVLWCTVNDAVVVPTGAHNCFSSVTVTGPLAMNIPDDVLLYAAM